MAKYLYRLGAFAARRAWIVVLAWVLILGAVGGAAAALREPFRGRVIQETFENIIHDHPPAPSRASPDGGIPPRLDEVVARAIAKSPGDRYQTMRELLEAIREVEFAE